MPPAQRCQCGRNNCPVWMQRQKARQRASQGTRKPSLPSALGRVLWSCNPLCQTLVSVGWHGLLLRAGRAAQHLAKAPLPHRPSALWPHPLCLPALLQPMASRRRCLGACLQMSGRWCWVMASGSGKGAGTTTLQRPWRQGEAWCHVSARIAQLEVAQLIMPCGTR